MASLIYRKEIFMESPLLVKSKEFSLDIIKICNVVKREKKGKCTYKSTYTQC